MQHWIIQDRKRKASAIFGRLFDTVRIVQAAFALLFIYTVLEFLDGGILSQQELWLGSCFSRAVLSKGLLLRLKVVDTLDQRTEELILQLILGLFKEPNYGVLRAGLSQGNW